MLAHAESDPHAVAQQVVDVLVGFVEISPVSVLEAWSVATPVLLSDIGPLRELIERSGGGTYTAREPDATAEQIISLLDQPEQLRGLELAGQRFWREHHTVETVGAT